MRDSDVISSGIKELWLVKSHWSVSAVINYERQTGWCSQMKQNMFGCAAQPSNDAGKQKDNCPLRWREKSFSRNRTAIWAVSSRKVHLKQEQQQMSARACGLITYTCTHLTCEITVDWERVTRELVETVSGESGSPYDPILRVRQRDVSPLHLKHQHRICWESLKWKFKDWIILL